MWKLKNKHLLKILWKSSESTRELKLDLITLDEEHNKLGVEVEKFVHSDLPRPNLAAEDSYDGGGVKKSMAGVSTTATRSRP